MLLIIMIKPVNETLNRTGKETAQLILSDLLNDAKIFDSLEATISK